MDIIKDNIRNKSKEEKITVAIAIGMLLIIAIMINMIQV